MKKEMEATGHIFSADDAQFLANTLQGTLATLLDLATQVKQAHWNLIGTGFASLHVQLDSVWNSIQECVDDVAERIVTLGLAADGSLDFVSEQSILPKYPAGLQDSTNTIELIAHRLLLGVQVLRAALEEIADNDLVSQDVLIGHIRTLEKHFWMLRAHNREA